MIEPAAVTAAAALLDPLVPAERRTALADALVRAEHGHARVLVLGEAKRGKSILYRNVRLAEQRRRAATGGRTHHGHPSPRRAVVARGP